MAKKKQLPGPKSYYRPKTVRLTINLTAVGAKAVDRCWRYWRRKGESRSDYIEHLFRTAVKVVP